MSRTSVVQSILDILDNLGKGQSRAVKVASAHSAPCPFSLAKASVLSCNMHADNKQPEIGINKAAYPKNSKAHTKEMERL